MTNQRNSTNLGRFTLRFSEDSSDDLEVGTFWRRFIRDVNSQNSDSGLSHHEDNLNKTSQEQDKDINDDKINDNDNNNNINNNNNNNIGTQTSHIHEVTDELKFISQLYDEPMESINDSQVISRHTPSEDIIGARFQLTRPPSQDQPLRAQSQPVRTLDENSHESFLVPLDAGLFDNSNEDSNKSMGSLSSGQFESTSTTSQSQPASLESGLSSSQCLRESRMQSRLCPEDVPYHEIMSSVVFALSGFQNHIRDIIKRYACAMGAKYTKTLKDCTHLICRFKSTPKYQLMVKMKGRIVREHWVADCSRQKKLVRWTKYKLGNYERPQSDDDMRDTLEREINESSRRLAQQASSQN